MAGPGLEGVLGGTGWWELWGSGHWPLGGWWGCVCAESLLFADDVSIWKTSGPLLILKATMFQKRKHRFREDLCLPKATGREEGAGL